jgi:hypothetical protein
VSLIIALDPGTRIVMYAGSVEAMRLRAPNAPTNNDLPGICRGDVRLRAELNDPVIETLEPGDAVRIDCCTVHAGSESDTDNIRIFVAINSRIDKFVRDSKDVYLWEKECRPPSPSAKCSTIDSEHHRL